MVSVLSLGPKRMLMAVKTPANPMPTKIMIKIGRYSRMQTPAGKTNQTKNNIEEIEKHRNKSRKTKKNKRQIKKPTTRVQRKKEERRKERAKEERRNQKEGGKKQAE